jgi:hypothetical protein
MLTCFNIFVLVMCIKTAVLAQPAPTSGTDGPGPVATEGPETTDKAMDPICEGMRGSGDSKTSILCIGQLTDSRLIIITRDYYVFELPIKVSPFDPYLTLISLAF